MRPFQDLTLFFVAHSVKARYCGVVSGDHLRKRVRHLNRFIASRTHIITPAVSIPPTRGFYILIFKDMELSA